MYDELTIYDEMMLDIPDKYDKSIGSWTSDFVMGAAISDATLYETLQLVADKLYVANLDGGDLDIFVSERTGIERKQATKATVQLSLSGNATIKIGDIFETEKGIRFASTEDYTLVNLGHVWAECLTPGAIGNVYSDEITKMPISIPGVNTVINEQDATGGFDAETDAEFLERYLDHIRKPITSGNKYFYRSFALTNEKVGDAKVIPLWNGVNTVKVVIVDRDKQPCTAEVVAEVQKAIDPNSSGTGDGIAPIGAKCTVVSADRLDINLECQVVLTGEKTLLEVKELIRLAVTQYLESIAFKTNTVSIAKVGAVILSCEGVGDYSTLKLNGVASNVTLTEVQTPMLSGVVVNA